MPDAPTRSKEIWLEAAGDAAADGPYTIQPTTTAREILATAGLQGWWLYTPGGSAFAYGDAVFDYVADNGKLRVANAGPKQVSEAGDVEATDAPELVADGVWRGSRQ
jgi:hypothetical protein